MRLAEDINPVHQPVVINLSVCCGSLGYKNSIFSLSMNRLWVAQIFQREQAALLRRTMLLRNMPMAHASLGVFEHCEFVACGPENRGGNMCNAGL